MLLTCPAPTSKLEMIPKAVKMRDSGEWFDRTGRFIQGSCKAGTEVLSSRMIHYPAQKKYGLSINLSKCCHDLLQIIRLPISKVTPIHV